MDATILYEMLHCLVCMVLACWLIQKTLHVPGYPALYAVTVAVVCLFLGDVYWLAHLMIRGSTPVILSACDAAYLGFWLILNAGLPRAGAAGEIKQGLCGAHGGFYPAELHWLDGLDQ